MLINQIWIICPNSQCPSSVCPHLNFSVSFRTALTVTTHASQMKAVIYWHKLRLLASLSTCASHIPVFSWFPPRPHPSSQPPWLSVTLLQNCSNLTGLQLCMCMSLLPPLSDPWEQRLSLIHPRVLQCSTWCLVSKEHSVKCLLS